MTSAMYVNKEQNVCQEKPDRFRKVNQRVVLSIACTQKGKLDIHSHIGYKEEFPPLVCD